MGLHRRGGRALNLFGDGPAAPGIPAAASRAVRRRAAGGLVSFMITPCVRR
jgi:hypothetical protein